LSIFSEQGCSFKIEITTKEEEKGKPILRKYTKTKLELVVEKGLGNITNDQLVKIFEKKH
jgi:hypothetical protein